jgi:phosphoribosylamine--glycine ligase
MTGSRPLNILIVGSGGREHALAWKAAQSPRLNALYVAPGNAGTAAIHAQAPVANLPLSPDDTPALTAAVREHHIDLALIGPEAPLAAGLADALRTAGILVFGPSQAAAQIEASKAFAKAFMIRHGIPTARYAAFTDFHQAIGHLLAIDYPVVVKASGLAAGKGVIMPDCADAAEAALRQIMLQREFGAAGDEVILEERLTGEEVSLLAFADGTTVRVMPAAQDHKRLLAGDQGPNTGGMGAYAPAPVASPAQVAEWTRTIMRPAVDGLRAEGRPFVGVLYAGLMLTGDGPKVLEFNCRFGDPETQVILPLLDADLFEILQACTEERLSDVRIRWREGAAATVVAAAGGYPGSYRKGVPIAGVADAEAVPGVAVFHAGTRRTEAGALITNGGRVLAVTGVGANVDEALSTAYCGLHAIRFEGIHYRRDIGVEAHRRDAARGELRP